MPILNSSKWNMQPITKLHWYTTVWENPDPGNFSTVFPAFIRQSVWVAAAVFVTWSCFSFVVCHSPFLHVFQTCVRSSSVWGFGTFYLIFMLSSFYFQHILSSLLFPCLWVSVYSLFPVFSSSGWLPDTHAILIKEISHLLSLMFSVLYLISLILWGFLPKKKTVTEDAVLFV